MCRAILIMLLTIVSNSAVAEWVKFYSNNNITIYIDPATIHDEGGSREMWTLTDFTKPQNISGKLFTSFISKNEMDCNAEQFRLLTLTFYSEKMGQGGTLPIASTPTKWNSFKGKVVGQIACVDMSSNATAEWIGMHVDYLVASLGQPQRSIPLSDGGRLLEYPSAQTTNATNSEISTPNLETLQNELESNNAEIAKLNKLMLNQHNAIDAAQRNKGIIGELQRELLLPDLQQGFEQLSNQRSALFEANVQIFKQLDLEKQMARNSPKQQVRSCSKLFTVNLRGSITDARCL